MGYNVCYDHKLKKINNQLKFTSFRLRVSLNVHFIHYDQVKNYKEPIEKLPISNPTP